MATRADRITASKHLQALPRFAVYFPRAATAWCCGKISSTGSTSIRATASLPTMRRYSKTALDVPTGEVWAGHSDFVCPHGHRLPGCIRPVRSSAARLDSVGFKSGWPADHFGTALRQAGKDSKPAISTTVRGPGQPRTSPRCACWLQHGGAVDNDVGRYGWCRPSSTITGPARWTPGSALAEQLPGIETEGRQRLAEAGVEVWPLSRLAGDTVAGWPRLSQGRALWHFRPVVPSSLAQTRRDKVFPECLNLR